MTTNGSCLCGAVSFQIEGALRPVIACHCGQCRKTSGHHVAATAAAKTAVSIQGADEIQWYASSDQARRGFCGTCGSQLFWDQHASDSISIFAGALDGQPELAIHSHIFCDDKGDYYELSDSAPKFSGTYDGESYP